MVSADAVAVELMFARLRRFPVTSRWLASSSGAWAPTSPVCGYTFSYYPRGQSVASVPGEICFPKLAMASPKPSFLKLQENWLSGIELLRYTGSQKW